MKTLIQFRRDTKENFETQNTILLDGEPSYETDTGLQKIGDGVTPYIDLKYLYDFENKVQSVELIGSILKINYTDDTFSEIDISSAIQDIYVSGATLDATTNILTLQSENGGADVTVNLSDFINSSELENELKVVDNKINAKSYLMEGISKVVINQTLGTNNDGLFTQNGWTYETAPENRFPIGGFCYSDDYVTRQINVFKDDILRFKIDSNNVDFKLKVGTTPNSNNLAEIHSNHTVAYAEHIYTEIEVVADNDGVVYFTIQGTTDNILVYNFLMTKPYGEVLRGIENYLFSSSTTKSLSANQGRILKDLVDTKVDKTTTINSKELTGNITLTKSDIGLPNVDNTSDLDKPVSNAQSLINDTKVAKVTSTDDALVSFSGTGGEVKNTTLTLSDLKKYIGTAGTTLVATNLKNIGISSLNWDGGVVPTAKAGTTTVTGLIGAVVGTWNASMKKVTSTDNAIVRFDGTTGAVQDSLVTVDDVGNVELITADKGVIMKSANGTRYRLTVDDLGNLETEAI